MRHKRIAVLAQSAGYFLLGIAAGMALVLTLWTEDKK